MGSKSSENITLDQNQPLTVESLLASDGVESLVNSGRVLSVVKHLHKAWVVIPPAGTQFGDKITYGMEVGSADLGRVTFKSPDGVDREAATVVDVSFEQARQIGQRVTAALESLKDTPFLKKPGPIRGRR